MKKIFLLIVFGCIYSLYSFSQISEGGIPPSFAYDQFLKTRGTEQRINYVSASHLNIQELIKEDEISKEIAAPLRIAVALPTLIDIESTGEWTTLPDGQKIWQQTVEAPEAHGLIIRYDEFYIPEGGNFFIYTDDKSQVLGAYTHNTNPSGGVFANGMLYSDRITMEYVPSTISKEQPRIVVKTIGYAYNLKDTGPGTAQSCMININCPEGNEWQVQKRGVVKLTIYYGGKGQFTACTGSLVNNTRQDGTPYILTAAHCFEDKAVEYESMIVTFNFERENCSNTSSYSEKDRLVGVDLLGMNPLKQGSDGALIKLKNNIPAEFNVYYNGWDADNTQASNGVIIHHPSGDVKKISTYTKKPSSITWVNGSQVGASGGHWKVEYASTVTGWSVTEGGSSGAPMFNQNKLIVGTLTGGRSDCNNKGLEDYYGKLWYHFDQHPNSLIHFKKYLDPDNTNVRVLQGYYPGSSIDNSTEGNIHLNVYPNPVKNDLYINSDKIINTIKIYDINGRLMYETKGDGSSTHTVSVSTWAKGIYNVVIDTEDGLSTQKVVKL